MRLTNILIVVVILAFAVLSISMAIPDKFDSNTETNKEVKE